MVKNTGQAGTLAPTGVVEKSDFLDSKLSHLTLADGDKHRIEGVCGNVSVPVSESLRGPTEAGRRGGPYSEKRPAIWKGEPPVPDEAWHGRMQDVYEELADDLGCRVRVVVGRYSARTAFRNLVG